MVWTALALAAEIDAGQAGLDQLYVLLLRPESCFTACLACGRSNGPSQSSFVRSARREGESRKLRASQEEQRARA